MKIGSAVVGVHVAVLCAFSLTQGCLTTGSDSPGRGARHKGPFQHAHKGKDAVVMGAQSEAIDYGTGLEGQPVYTSEPIDITPIEPAPTYIAPSVATETYIVRKGDTLSQLAVDFDTTTAELVRLNGLSNPDVLYVGQELRVPAGRRGSAAAAASSKSAPAVKKGGSYVIQKGDTLSEIALAAGVSIDSLRKLNNIQGDKIMAGETLSIPEGGKIPPTKTQKSTTTTSAPKTESKPKVEEPAAAAPAIAGIAAAEETAAPEGTAPASFDVIEERIYYPGESLDDIAREYGVSKAEIMRLNGITDETQIKDGQRLRIPIAE